MTSDGLHGGVNCNVFDVRDVVAELVQIVCLRVDGASFCIDRLANPTNVHQHNNVDFKLPLARQRYREKERVETIAADSDSEAEFETILREGRLRREWAQRRERWDETDSNDSDAEGAKLPDSRSNLSERRRTDTVSVVSTVRTDERGVPLPPIEKLCITVDEETPLKRVGIVDSIVDDLVIILADAGKNGALATALDEESIFFTKNRHSLGRVFEIWGPVRQPYYSIRFNNNEEIVETGLKKGDVVFYAPTKQEYTHHIFTQQLMREQHDDYQPASDEEIFFSDDEKERQYKAQKANNADVKQKRKRPHAKSNRGKQHATQQSRMPYRSYGRPWNRAAPPRGYYPSAQEAWQGYEAPPSMPYWTPAAQPSPMSHWQPYATPPPTPLQQQNYNRSQWYSSQSRQFTRATNGPPLSSWQMLRPPPPPSER